MIKLSIVEDNALLRNLLENYIEFQSDIEILSSHDSIKSYLATYTSDSVTPNILILDINLPGISGLQGLPMITEKHPKTEVIIYSNQLEENVILEALTNGAYYYASKLDSMQKLLEHVRMIHNGRTQILNHWARKMLNIIRQEAKHFSALQIQLLDALSIGSSYSDISRDFNCTVATIESESKDILSRLHRLQSNKY